MITNHTGSLYIEKEIELLWVQSMMKTKQNNDVIDSTCLFYNEIGIELSWLIGQDAVCHEK